MTKPVRIFEVLMQKADFLVYLFLLGKIPQNSAAADPTGQQVYVRIVFKRELTTLVANASCFFNCFFKLFDIMLLDLYPFQAQQIQMLRKTWND